MGRLPWPVDFMIHMYLLNSLFTKATRVESFTKSHYPTYVNPYRRNIQTFLCLDRINDQRSVILINAVMKFRTWVLNRFFTILWVGVYVHRYETSYATSYKTCRTYSVFFCRKKSFMPSFLCSLKCSETKGIEQFRRKEICKGAQSLLRRKNMYNEVNHSFLRRYARK